MIGAGAGAHGEPEQDGDDVDHGVAGGVGQAVGDGALLEQVAEEQHADQNHGARRDHGADQEGGDGKDDTLALTDGSRCFHVDAPFLFGREQAHDGWLDDGDQRHVAVGGDGDGTEQMRSEFGTEKDGGGAVCAADDADGACFRGSKPEIE